MASGGLMIGIIFCLDIKLQRSSNHELTLYNHFGFTLFNQLAPEHDIISAKQTHVLFGTP